MQRDSARSFVSRTQLMSTQWGGRPIAVFRMLLANPDTTHAILQDILDEQRALAAASLGMAPLVALVAAPDAG